MTQKEKQEVLVAICGYLPYGLKLNVRINPDICSIDLVRFDNFGTYARLIEEGEYSVKPYLRKLSSMTGEEMLEIEMMNNHSIQHIDTIGVRFQAFYDTAYEEMYDLFDYLNKHKFDYRRDKDGKTMIERGMAIEAPEGMYNTKTTCNNCENKSYCS